MQAENKAAQPNVSYRTRDEWTFEQAVVEETDSLLPLFDPRRPRSKWWAMRGLDEYKSEFDETQNGFAILAAIRECARVELVMPPWLASEFINRYDKVLNLHAISWDEAFDKPYPKGTNIIARKKSRDLRFAVLNAVNEAKRSDPNTPISAELFSRVGKPLGLGKSKAEELYYEAKKMMGF